MKTLTTENTELTEKMENRKPDPGDTELDRINKITDQIIGAAIAVHRALGPGLLESTYEVCLAYELSKSGVRRLIRG